MLTNETVFKTNLLILHPTCPGAGKQTKLPADNWYSINICCKNKWSYINEQILKKKRMHDSSSIEAFKTTKSQLEKQNLNFDQEYRKKH